MSHAEINASFQLKKLSRILEKLTFHV